MGAKTSKESGSTDTFEKVLAEFEARLRRCQLSLAELKLTETRILNWVTFYGFCVWGLLLALFFTDRIPLSLFGSLGNFEIVHTEDENGTSSTLPLESTVPFETFFRSLLRIGVVLFGPLILYKFRHLVSWYYARKRAQIEDEIETIKQKQTDKVEELKTITDFYKAKQLIERYDASLHRTISQEPPIVEPPSFPIHVHRPLLPSTSEESFDESRPQTLADSNPNWFNKLLDRIVVGKDFQNPQYALICSHCYQHNGLALPDQFMTLTYRCRECHTLNGPIEPPRFTPPSTPLAHTPIAGPSPFVSKPPTPPNVNVETGPCQSEEIDKVATKDLEIKSEINNAN